MDTTHQKHASRTSFFRGATAASLVLLSCAVHAQGVYKCQINGHTAFQSSPCPSEPRSAAAAPQPAAVVDVAGPPKKKTLADLLRERDGADRPRPTHEAQSDGANVLRSRMGAV